MTKNEKDINPLQKGTRRQKLHKNQDNVGNDENRAEYTDFNGKPIKQFGFKIGKINFTYLFCSSRNYKNLLFR